MNGLVNRAGTTFAFRLGEETGASAARHRARRTKRRARSSTRTRCGATSKRSTARVGVDVQTEMYLASRRLVERGARWLLRYRPQPLPVAATVASLRSARRAPRRDGGRVTGDRGGDRALRRAGRARASSPARSRRSTICPRALDIAELAAAHDVEVEVVAAAVRRGRRRSCGFDWLGDRIVELAARRPLGRAGPQRAPRGRGGATPPHRRRGADARVRTTRGPTPRGRAIARVLALLDEIRAHARLRRRDPVGRAPRAARAWRQRVSRGRPRRRSRCPCRRPRTCSRGRCRRRAGAARTSS